jgi:hypothetical protein
MKIVLGILLLTIIAFAFVQFYSMRSQQNIETYKYNVVKKYEDFEVRRYEPALFTSVQITNDGYSNASSKGFSILGGYIFGANEKKESIAMTSPVTMSMEESMTMMFMVPSKYSIEDLPTPENKNIEFKQIPARKMAAITFGGWANDEKIETYKQKLIGLLQKEGLPYTDKFYFYGYNPPYEVFNRKNEVVIELE